MCVSRATTQHYSEQMRIRPHAVLAPLACPTFPQVLDGCLRGSPVTEEFNLTEALGFFEAYPDLAEEVG